MSPRAPTLSPTFQPMLLALGFALLLLIGGTSVWLVAQTDADSAREASSRRARQFLIASLCGILLIFLLAAASIIIVRRSTGRMMAAQKALKEANESLEETVSRRTAELRQANEEIQNFAYVVSHDLRAPLVNIMGFTSELEVMRKGGALGAYQAGVYQGLSEAGYEPDWLSGISIGAVNAAIIAGNEPAQRTSRHPLWLELPSDLDGVRVCDIGQTDLN